ncbi:Major facilitator superfamily permease [Nostocoides japonicum T1-X7]|uniref:Major facilitator superfamily permease n=1 Tax=Nostocoides japonicum T1-X7 TaxID=1194083 RepID=A0A077LUF8_9MICO|nr:MFS transporter [Tetrasphaera japonica]CCH77151.1 Major facilitator superfamily permease [Tetrasphaera japonica T1-X7]
MTTDAAVDDRMYAENARYQRPWYWYDWANSAFVTTVGTVLFGPYITAVAKQAACPGIDSDATCTTNLHVLGIPIAPGSLAPFTVTFATIVSAVVLVFIGAIADRSPRPAGLLGAFAFAGAVCASLMVFVTGTRWALGSGLMILATVFLGASLVVYDSILCRIAAPDDRDRVSSKGWAFGYLGGGLLLAINLVMLLVHDSLGMTEGQAARVSILSAGLWWGIFTLVPVIGMWRLRGQERLEVARDAGIVTGSIRQLRSTLSDLRYFPETRRFLLAYLFFNDGIQTVITSSSLYGAEQLKFSQTQLFQLILLVQFVAFGGALLFGRLAARFGAWRTILWSLVAWIVIVVLAFFLPERAYVPFVALGILIGIVLGGTQALSRSLYSQLVPRSREAEFFSFYQAMERGTSWFGTFLFGLVYQFTHSYRIAIVALVVFFVLGGAILRRVDVRKGILDAGNQLPTVV